MRRWLTRALLALAALVMILVGLAYRADIAPAVLRKKYATAESEFIPVEPGLVVHVRDEGAAEAPVLVLLHGSNSSLQTWEPWVARLKNDYRVITMDLPGHGLTGPHPRDAYFPENSVAVVDAVLRAKNIKRFTLGGNSMGGGISWHYALTHPEKLAGLILVDAAGAPSSLASARDLPLGFRLARMPIIKDIGTKLTPRSMIEKSVRQTVSVQSSVSPQVVDRYWELLRYPGNRRATIVRFEQYRDDPAFRKLSSLTVPTLILWGADDTLIPQAAAAAFAKILPHHTSIIYPHVGHLPMEEIPARSAADVHNWLTGNTVTEKRQKAKSK